jgi:selenocysteine lyase/cysteine desulfurase
MSEPQSQETPEEDELEEIARRAARSLINASSDVEVLKLQFATEGMYVVEIVERGQEPREVFPVTQS